MQLEVGSIVDGKVTGITKFGAFVELEGGKTGMVHISEVASAYVKEIRDYVTDGQQVKVKIMSIGDDGKISLSIKRVAEPSSRRPATSAPSRSGGGYRSSGTPSWQSTQSEPRNFDDMVSRFMQSCDEKITALRKGSNEQRRSPRRSGGRNNFDYDD